MCAINVWTNWIQILLLWAVGRREGGAGAFSSSPVVHYSCMCRFHQRSRSYISRLFVSIIYAIFDVFKSHTHSIDHRTLFIFAYVCLRLPFPTHLVLCIWTMHSTSEPLGILLELICVFVIVVCYSCMLNVFEYGAYIEGEWQGVSSHTTQLVNHVPDKVSKVKDIQLFARVCISLWPAFVN